MYGLNLRNGLLVAGLAMVLSAGCGDDKKVHYRRDRD